MYLLKDSPRTSLQDFTFALVEKHPENFILNEFLIKNNNNNLDKK